MTPQESVGRLRDLQTAGVAGVHHTVQMKLNDGLRRFFLAWGAAVLAVGICLWQGHVHVDLQRPETVLHVFQHKCGILMALCILWVWAEAILLVISPAPYRNTIRWPKGRWERRRWVRES